MKKYLFVIPLLLLILNLLPLAIYKDTVRMGPNVHSLRPAHWHVISLDTSTDAVIGAASQAYDPNITGPVAAAPAISKGASFKGFPFGAYLSRGAHTKTGDATPSFAARAWSWLWALLDVIVFLAGLALAFVLNRRKRTVVTPTPAQAPAPYTGVLPAPVEPNVTTESKPTVPATPPPPQPSTPAPQQPPQPQAPSPAAPQYPSTQPPAGPANNNPPTTTSGV